MRKILIVGAGQAGVTLARGLQLHGGYDVTLINGKTSDEVRTGTPRITQFSLPRALRDEQRLDLDRWSGFAPRIIGLRQPVSEPLAITGTFPDHAFGIAVDARVKLADWLEMFEDKGGKVVINGVTIDTLDYFTRMYDLIVIATGGGELGALFDTDRERFSGASERVVTQVFVRGLTPSPAGRAYADVISSPIGRVIIAPIQTDEIDTLVHSITVLDKPGGVLDGGHLADSGGGHRGPDPQAIAEWIRTTLGTYAPATAARMDHIEPVKNSGLVTTSSPVVRKPVSHLPSGGAVLGIGDVVMTTDPISGQGWNVSTMSARIYLERILAHGDRPFDAAWMQETFDAYYEAEGQHSALLSAALDGIWDNGEPPAFFQAIIAAAVENEKVAAAYAHGLDDPSTYGWFFSEQAAMEFLAQHQ
ncbi:styrene monooxygenase/indole monooxygenase family protein [Nocardiopsis sediminis]|uniref:Styrene monooxygenase/indole monooxygenase family protein n=1 Tax=Nocardiopsis sediminis TaxID=1778267 RepID=A0ABV8FGN8_9ACTN